jgi:hypothetical protein
VIEITQFEKGVQLVPIGTEPVKRRINAGDPPYRYIIGIYQSTLCIKAALEAVVDLRSGHRSTEIIPPVRISKHGRERQKRTISTLISKSHTNIGANPRELGHRVFRKLKHGLIWAFNLFNANLNHIWRPK